MITIWSLMPQVSDLNMVRRSTIIRVISPEDWGGIYLMENRDQFAPVMEGNLWGLMHPICKGVISKQGYIGGRGGMVATGSPRVKHGFGQGCYGGATILSNVGNAEVFTFMILGHFTNETLNKDFVKNAASSTWDEGHDNKKIGKLKAQKAIPDVHRPCSGFIFTNHYLLALVISQEGFSE
jgi:hypothetical protein